MDKLPSNINDLIEHASYVVCKLCGLEKKKYKNGVYPNGKDARFVDEHDREWSGRCCPDCHSMRTAKRAKNKRDTKKLYV